MMATGQDRPEPVRADPARSAGYTNRQGTISNQNAFYVAKAPSQRSERVRLPISRLWPVERMSVTHFGCSPPPIPNWEV
jgi:hypothetical protein